MALTTPLWARRWGNDRVFVAIALGTAVSLLPLALLPHWGAAGLGIIGLIVLNAMAIPTISVFHQELVEDTWKPTMSGAFSMASALGWTAIAAVGGFLIEAWGYASFFLGSAGMTIVGTLFFAIYFRRVGGE
jgi:predicted MFS family arabinose efflux permease